MAPSPSGSVLAGLQELARLVGGMAALARDSHWAALPAQDALCTALVARLREMEAGELGECERAQFAALVARIAGDQAEVQGLVQPQFAQLVRRMDEVQRATPGAQHRPS